MNRLQQISISKGNTKMGRIPSVSTTPCRTCVADAPCRRECYAMKAFRMYPGTRAAYRRNERLARTDRDAFFAQVDAYLTLHSPPWFRWHVSGDILDLDYLRRMLALARAHPRTRFLAFTKNYACCNRVRVLPTNFSLVYSAWPGYPMRNPLGRPVAWMRPRVGAEPRIPTDALECPGNCETCAACWGLAQRGIDVVFDQH